MNILFVYDDMGEVPDTIRRIIGVGRFGDIVRRGRRLSDTIQEAVEATVGCEFVRIEDAAALRDVRARISRLSARAMVFRLPSSIAPGKDMFGPAVAKLPFALDPVLYGETAASDAPALLSRDDALAILGEADQSQRRKFFSGFEERALRVTAVDFFDIAQISHFLAFMAGGTEARHFNVTSFEAGVFRKWSRDVTKIRNEYRYFHIVDEAMKRFLIPTFDYAEQADGAGYAMEHLSVPDASLQLQHHTFDIDSFSRLMDHFFAFVRARGRRDLPAAEVRAVAHRDIVVKLERRIAGLRATPVGQRLDALLLAVGPEGGLDRLVARCKAMLAERIAASPIDHLALGHGDPCFSNILYNADINLFRLIDPRGAATREEGFTHPAYDLAKFSHSAIGGYDFINGGLADCRFDRDMTLMVAMDRGGPPAWMAQAFRKRLADEGWDLRLVRAIEASLFLSMLPLHADLPAKLPAFCLIADAILRELDSE